MVALIIIAIGTLGIAKMQALALASTGASRSRALAAIEASSLADAMHANRAYWQSQTSTPGNINVTAANNTATVTSTSGTMQAALTTVAGSLCGKTATMNATLSCYCAAAAPPSACTGSTVSMAASDLFDWSASLGNLLPSATANVACHNSNSPVDCTIVISWTENAVALNSQEANVAAANAAVPVSFTLYVVP
jgi:type IV pilus assembly protein PilV